MAEEQSMLDRWFLQQEIIDQLLGQGEEREDAESFGQRIAAIAATTVITVIVVIGWLPQHFVVFPPTSRR